MKEDITGSGEVKTRKSVLTGLGILSFFSILRLFPIRKAPPPEKIACSPSNPKETMKLLSQDGQLVEVDVSRIKSLQKKISDQELQNWIIKK
jgi:hypothetical protein